MNDVAYEQLIEHLGRDGAPGTPALDASLAAADGPDALEAHLDGAAAPVPRDVDAAPPAPTPARVYLEHVPVENFRGVGPAAKLQVAPGPGLTLVVGRNGSGKSSFAEGLELLLTGTNLRWEGRTKVWREGWRHLHGTGPARLAARFRVDGAAEPLDVRRSWATWRRRRLERPPPRSPCKPTPSVVWTRASSTARSDARRPAAARAALQWTRRWPVSRPV